MRARGPWLLLLIVGAAWAAPSALPQPPQLLFKGLYDVVERDGLYSDSKVFADAMPREAPARIMARYRAEHPIDSMALKRFVDAHFILPAPTPAAQSAPSAERAGLQQHIEQLWDRLTRSTPTAPPYSSLLPLPEPYVVPGGRFREIYYWDSYFTMLGLLTDQRQDLVSDMVKDFAYLIDRYGHIPNGTRSYYLSRSQPPFFFAMVGLLSPNDPAAAYQRYLPQLKREYAFWMQGAAQLKPGMVQRRVVALDDGAVLNRYWDDQDTPRDESYREDTALAAKSGREPRQLYRDLRAAAESGWDFSSRWLADGHTLGSIQTTRLIPVDLNSLLFGLESAIRDGCARAGDERCTQEFTQHAQRRRQAMQRYLWDSAMGAYLDYDFTRSRRVSRLSAATLYPLFVALPDASQAQTVAVTASRSLLAPGGLVTTPLSTGEQWDAPNGWAPLQWIAVSGLRRYAQPRLAEAIACRWLVNVSGAYAVQDKLVEKYDVEQPGRSGGGGEYPTQDGFGWTNGVTRQLMSLYPADVSLHDVSACPGV